MSEATKRQVLGNRRWRIASLLGVGVLINYFDRVNLTVAKDALTHDFGISYILFGYLLSSYNWTYAACQLPMGWLLDKMGVKRIGRIGTLLCSIASLLTAVAPSVSALFGARFLLGIGESPLFPSNSKAIGNWFPRDARSLASSLFDSAAKFASALGVPLIGVLLLTVGWRWSIAITGLLTLAYLGLFAAVYREPEEDEKLTAEEYAYIRDTPTLQDVVVEESSFGFWELMLQPKVIGLSIGITAYNYTFYLLFTWLPTYLSKQLGIDLLHSFLYTGVPWLCAALVDIAVGGWMVDWLIARGMNASRVRMTVLVLGMCFGIGILGAAYAHTATQALFWITVANCGLAAAAPVVWTVPTVIAPRRNVASVAAIANFSGQIGGAIAAPIVTGYLVTMTHSFASAFLVAGGFLVIGALAYVVLLRRIEPMQMG